MARKVRDSNLETRTARSRLRVRHKPYFRLIEPGLHLGYRRLASGPGTWIARRYSGGGSYTVKNLTTADNRLVIADDYSEPDGDRILSFAQAQEKAQARHVHAERFGRLTVRDAVESYLESKEADGRDVVDSRCRANAHIYPTLGDIECEELTTDTLRKWHRALAKALPRTRSKPGKEQRYRAFSGEKEAVRQRQASANRVMTILKAALNQAFDNGKVASDAAWRKVKRFKGVDAARLRYLTVAEANRLINACDPDFGKLVQAALQTGARYGQLAQLVVSDFNPDVGTIRMRTRKGDGHDKQYHVTLTIEGVSFFEELCVGRTENELMLQNTSRRVRTLEDNGQWRESEQERRMVDACKNAKINPPIGFHGLRHTWASHAVMNGVPLLVVAKNLGHSDTRMVERHYGHLAPSYVADAIRAGGPKFGFKPDKRIVALTR
jgi:integrase